MASPLDQTSFAAGELAPHLFGRTDLKKYLSGTAMMRNFFVDYRGGASTRPGTEFVGVVDSAQAAPRLIPFNFSTQQAYVLVLSASGKMLFVSDGAYVLEAADNITGYTAQATFTVANSYAAGDLVYLSGIDGLNRQNGVSGFNGRTLRVVSATATEVQLEDPINGAIDASTYSAYVSGGTIARVYSISIPWSPSDFFALVYTQSADVLTITHPSYPPYNLNRYGATNWTLEAVTLGSKQAAPTNGSLDVVVGAISSGQTQPAAEFNYVYAVTAISAGREESQPLVIGPAVSYPLNQNNGQSIIVRWDAPAGAASYNVYRATPWLSGAQVSAPYFYGFIGRTTSTNFIDLNIAPDFTTVPPTHQSPFTNIGPIVAPVTIGQAGFGYRSPVAVVGNAPGANPAGSGGTVSLATNSAGGIASGTITAGGANYSAPTLAVQESDTTLGSGLALAYSGAVTAGSGGNYVPASGSITISTAGAGYHIAYIEMAFGTSPVSSGTALGLISNGVVSSIEILKEPTTSSSSTNTLAFTITDVLPGDGRAPGSQAYATVTPQGGGGPGVCAYFEQRKVYAASDAAPDTFWMSRPGQYANFDTSLPVQADDALTGTIVSSQVNKITSLTAMPSGLITLTSDGAYQISGGYPGTALAPSTIQATSQAFNGASPLPPLRVNYDLIYEQSRGSGVRDLQYNFYVNVYTGTLISALSSHLFDGHKLSNWAYAEEPYYIIWAIRDDGALLSLTYLKEQEIFGWARHDTYGKYASVAVVPEGNTDVPYFTVQRPLGSGQWTYLVERQASRFYGQNTVTNEPTDPELPWCADCGVRSPLTYPAANLTLDAAATSGTTYTFNADAPVFVAGDAGSTLRVAGGVGTIKTVSSSTSVVVDMTRPITGWLTNTTEAGTQIAPQPSGDWSVTASGTAFGGLDHLNGQTVAIVADGSVVDPQVVIDGCVTLSQPASFVTAGLPFTAQIMTLRLDAGRPPIGSRRKQIPAITLRTHETRGLMVGAAWDSLVEVKQREDEPLGTPMGYESNGGVQPPQITGGVSGLVPYFTEDRRIVLDSRWTTDGQICIQQSYPLPATILATITEVEVGDQPDQ